MESNEILNYSLAISSLILVGFVSWVSYHLVQNLKILKRVLLNIEGVTDNIELVNSGIKIAIANLLKMFLGRKGVKK